MNKGSLINIPGFYGIIVTSRCSLWFCRTIDRSYPISMASQSMDYFSWVDIMDDYLIFIISWNDFAWIRWKADWLYSLSGAIYSFNPYAFSWIPNFDLIKSCWRNHCSIWGISYRCYGISIPQKLIIYIFTLFCFI